MADEMAIWNTRTQPSELLRPVVICRIKDLEFEQVIEITRKLSSLTRNITKNQLWSEIKIMQAVIYKNQNQHRKEKYFQGLKRIQRYLTRLKEMSLQTTISALVQQFPRKKGDASSSTLKELTYPCVQSVQNVLLQFMGAAKLATQIICHIRTTFKYSCSQLALGFFVKFHIVNTAALSRFCVLLKDFCYNICDCYDALFAWLKILRDAQPTDKQTLVSLPACLKTWLGSDLEFLPTDAEKRVNNTCSTITPRTSILLNKLFAMTPNADKETELPSEPEPSNKLTFSTLQDPFEDDVGEAIGPLDGSFLSAEILQRIRAGNDGLPDSAIALSATKLKLSPDKETECKGVIHSPERKRLRFDQVFGNDEPKSKSINSLEDSYILGRGNTESKGSKETGNAGNILFKKSNLVRRQNSLVLGIARRKRRRHSLGSRHVKRSQWKEIVKQKKFAESVQRELTLPNVLSNLKAKKKTVNSMKNRDSFMDNKTNSLVHGEELPLKRKLSIECQKRPRKRKDNGCRSDYNKEMVDNSVPVALDTNNLGKVLNSEAGNEQSSLHKQEKHGRTLAMNRTNSTSTESCKNAKTNREFQRNWDLKTNRMERRESVYKAGKTGNELQTMLSSGKKMGDGRPRREKRKKKGTVCCSPKISDTNSENSISALTNPNLKYEHDLKNEGSPIETINIRKRSSQDQESMLNEKKKSKRDDDIDDIFSVLGL